VPSSEIPGEQAWPTQPFPSGPPPFARQRLTKDDIDPFILTADERQTWKDRIGKAKNDGLFTPPSLRDTVSIPGAQGGANWGCTASNPTNGTVYVLSINVPSIYKLSTEAPTPGGGRGRAGGAGDVQVGERTYDTRCASCHSADLNGSGNYPSLVDVTSRMGPDPIRETIKGGRPGMPSFDDLTEAEVSGLVAFLGNPGNRAGRGGPPRSLGGPVVEAGAAPGARAVPPGRAGGMMGPAYPEGITVPEVRMYTDYGMNGTIVKPPYSTLTAYDLNTGTIKWQIPAGGDDARAVAEGARDTGYISQRTGIITTSTGLLFHAGGDGKLRVYDAETGKVLWTTTMPAGSRGIPSMYEVNGRQFFVVNATSTIVAPRGRAAGAGAQVAPPLARAYVAYALPARQ
jgi:quinoprotein glucose dehydrogenase